MGWDGRGALGGVEMLVNGFHAGMCQIIANHRENAQREEEFEMSWLFEYNKLTDRYNNLVHLHNAQLARADSNFEGWTKCYKDFKSLNERAAINYALANSNHFECVAAEKKIEGLKSEIAALKLRQGA